MGNYVIHSQTTRSARRKTCSRGQKGERLAWNGFIGLTRGLRIKPKIRLIFPPTRWSEAHALFKNPCPKSYIHGAKTRYCRF